MIKTVSEIAIMCPDDNCCGCLTEITVGLPECNECGKKYNLIEEKNEQKIPQATKC